MYCQHIWHEHIHHTGVSTHYVPSPHAPTLMQHTCAVTYHAVRVVTVCSKHARYSQALQQCSCRQIALALLQCLTVDYMQCLAIYNVTQPFPHTAPTSNHPHLQPQSATEHHLQCYDYAEIRHRCCCCGGGHCCYCCSGCLQAQSLADSPTEHLRVPCNPLSRHTASLGSSMLGWTHGWCTGTQSDPSTTPAPASKLLNMQSDVDDGKC